jgi:energy-coupling factor transporter ATP-binding protein EcfA2
MELLRRDPAARPSAGKVLERLARLRVEGRAAPRQRQTRRREGFIGRQRELFELQRAWQETQQGESSVVLLHGSSGMGKSTLVRHFLRSLPPEALILRSHCYQHEAMPYKGIDGVIDALGVYLSRLPAETAAALLPAEASALARLFPALQAVPSLRQLPAGTIADAEQQRRVALFALRELLTRLCRHRPCVLSIDDLQWGDLDSLVLLAELLRPPRPPPLLFVLAYRSEEADSNAVLRELLRIVNDALTSPGASAHLHALPLDELSAAEATLLAQALLGGPREGERAEHIASESRGNPFFITELARAKAMNSAGAESIDALVRARVAELPAAAQRLLQVVAVAGQPIARPPARQAASVTSASPEDGAPEWSEPQALAQLRAAHLVRVRSGHGTVHDELETYHDRIREAVTASLDGAALRERHAGIAQALESWGRAAPERLAFHFLGAEKREPAARYSLQAGELALRALAFDRAAQLYGQALAQGTLDAAAELTARIGRADALAALGLSRDAATEYLQVAAREAPKLRLSRQRQAAEQLLHGGCIEEALALLGELFPQVGVTLHASTGRALLDLGALRLRLLANGVRSQASAAVRDDSCEERLQLLKCAVTGLVVNRPVLTWQLHARYYLEALRARDDRHLACVYALEMMLYALFGERSRAAAERMYARAAEAAQRSGDIYSQVYVRAIGTGAALFLGDWRLAERRSADAIRLAQERLVGATWEIESMQINHCTALLMLGDLRQLAEMVPALQCAFEARDSRGNLNTLRSHMQCCLHLAEDQPERTRLITQEFLPDGVAPPRMDHHRFSALLNRLWLAFYEGDSAGALSVLRHCWLACLRGGFLHMTFSSVLLRYSLARSALQSKPGRLTRLLAARIAKQLLRNGTPYANAYAALLQAEVARQKGQHADELRLLSRTDAVFTELGMGVYAHCARRFRGERMGGAAGRALVEQADAWLSAQGIKNPVRMTAAMIL